MNSKKAKTLRRSIDYHPSDERRFENQVTQVITKTGTFSRITQVLHSGDKRALYQSMKREVCR